MLAAMLRTSLLIAALFVVPALAAPPIDALTSVIAKAPAKKGKGKETTKPGDKGVEKPPERLPSDPRSNGSSTPAAVPDNGMASEVRRGMSRIEFDDRLIQGQTNKANAIYLFERRESALRSLLKKRTDFHEEIDETLD
jgi:hypothetical protein